MHRYRIFKSCKTLIFRAETNQTVQCDTEDKSLTQFAVSFSVFVSVKMSLELTCVLLFRNYVFQKRYVKFDGKNLMYFGSDKVQTTLRVFLMYLMSLQTCLFAGT